MEHLKKLSSLMVVIFLGVYMNISTAFGVTDVMELGPKVNDKIPHSLEINTSDEQPEGFEKLTGDNGLVLLFVRSVDWCPYCRAQLKEWNNSLDKFHELGYKVAAVSYDQSEKANKFIEKENILYTIVSDVNLKIIKTFGILNQDVPKGSTAYGIPHPYIYVVSSEGTVLHRFAEQGYKKRPSIEEVYHTITKK